MLKSLPQKIFLCLLFFLSPITWADGYNGVYASLGTGLSNIEVSSKNTVSGIDDQGSGLLLVGDVGYRFGAFTADATLRFSSGTDGLFSRDGHHVSEYALGLGYALFKGTDINLVPKLGYAYWHQTSDDGSSKRATIERASRYGHNFVWQLDIELSDSKSGGVVFSLRKVDFDFGQIASYSLAYRLYF